MRNSYLILFFLVLIVFLLLELSIFSLPLVFIFSVVVLAFYRSLFAFLFVLFAGLTLDAIRVDNFGITPLFVFSTFLAVHLYERYFGSPDVLPIALITVVGTFIYAYVLSYSLFSVILMFLILGALLYAFHYLVKKGVL